MRPVGEYGAGADNLAKHGRNSGQGRPSTPKDEGGLESIEHEPLEAAGESFCRLVAQARPPAFVVQVHVVAAPD